MRETHRIETGLIYQESAPNFLVTGYLAETIMEDFDFLCFLSAYLIFVYLR